MRSAARTWILFMMLLAVVCLCHLILGCEKYPLDPKSEVVSVDFAGTGKSSVSVNGQVKEVTLPDTETFAADKGSEISACTGNGTLRLYTAEKQLVYQAQPGCVQIKLQ